MLLQQNRGLKQDEEQDTEAVSGELKPIILQNSGVDDRVRHGMLDLICLTTESDILAEISRQDFESVVRLELQLRESRINVSSAACGLLSEKIIIQLD
jgi:hypothetical protein